MSFCLCMRSMCSRRHITTCARRSCCASVSASARVQTVHVFRLRMCTCYLRLCFVYAYACGLAPRSLPGSALAWLAACVARAQPWAQDQVREGVPALQLHLLPLQVQLGLAAVRRHLPPQGAGYVVVQCGRAAPASQLDMHVLPSVCTALGTEEASGCGFTIACLPACCSLGAARPVACSNAPGPSTLHCVLKRTWLAFRGMVAMVSLPGVMTSSRGAATPSCQPRTCTHPRQPIGQQQCE